MVLRRPRRVRQRLAVLLVRLIVCHVDEYGALDRLAANADGGGALALRRSLHLVMHTSDGMGRSREKYRRVEGTHAPEARAQRYIYIKSWAHQQTHTRSTM